MKKIIGIILIVFGAFPFIATLGIAAYRSINGYCFSILVPCTKEYGINVFLSETALFGVIFWYIYLIALILIIIGVILIKKAKVKKDVR